MSQMPFVVYLLCFNRSVDGLKHYVGITTTNRLQARMLEHQNGRGARLTALAFEDRTGFALTSLWPCAHPTIERVIAGTPFLSTQCSRCSGGDYWVQYEPKKKRPIPRNRPLILDWAEIQPKLHSPETPEKERARVAKSPDPSLPVDNR